MKKIVSLGIASAVLAMTALSASAAVVINTTDAVEEGKTITVTFTADGAIAAGSGVGFTVTASGVKLEKSEPTTAMMASIGESGKFAAVTMAEQPAGVVLLTQTYTVTAKAGEAVSINVSALEGFADSTVTPVATTVKDTASSSDSGSTSTDSGSTSTDSGSTSTDSGSTSSTPGGDVNPGTGVALAVFPAVIAGAAVVVAKKKRG